MLIPTKCALTCDDLAASENKQRHTKEFTSFRILCIHKIIPIFKVLLPMRAIIKRKLPIRRAPKSYIQSSSETNRRGLEACPYFMASHASFGIPNASLMMLSTSISPNTRDNMILRCACTDKKLPYIPCARIQWQNAQ